jgi:hypothetical protein
MEDNCKKHIERIIEFLNARKMSVLVGAGFSKNVDSDFPSWNELLIPLVKELYKHDYSKYKKGMKFRKSDDVDELDSKFIKKIIGQKSYLQIVDEYIIHKGYRESIDYYIYEQFRMKNVIGRNYSEEDLEIHTLLLNLPWNNVYTTNYDNLLEQADQFSVTNRENITHAEKLTTGPIGKIVKLHGSFVDGGELNHTNYNFDEDIYCNLVISKEDYLNYPQRHEAFASLMKISLLQEAFCLIGFSANDPNFLDWADWVRNLLKNRMKKQNSIDNFKVFFIDVKNIQIEPDRELFLNNNGIVYIPLKKAFPIINTSKIDENLSFDYTQVFERNGKSKKAEEQLEIRNLFKKFFSKIVGRETKNKLELKKDLKPELKDSLDFMLLSGREIYKKCFDKISHMSRYKIGTDNYFDSLDFLINNESHFFLPNNSIAFYSEQLKRSLIVYMQEPEQENTLNVELLLKYFSFLAFFTRQNFYNLVSVFDEEGPEKLKEIIAVFERIDYSKLENAECINQWFDFAVCLLENYRRFDDIDKFEKLYDFIIENSIENKFIYEAKYQYGILLAMHSDYVKLENLLVEFEIEEKNEYSYFFVKKAFLYSIINTQEYMDLIIPTIKKGLQVCNVNQIRTILYEVLFYYARSADLKEAYEYKFELDVLKSKGFYTIGSISDELLKYEEDDKIIPKGSDKYTLKGHMFGNSNYNKQFDHSLKLNEFVIKSGILPIFRIKYQMSIINQNKWFKLNKLFYSWYPEHILYQSLQYGQNDSDQKYSESVFQIICNSSELTHERKLNIYNQLLKLFDYYYSIEEFEQIQVVLSGISMLSEIIEYKDWKYFWKKLWRLQDKDKKIENLFYRGHWGWSKQIRRMLPFIDNKKECIIKFLNPEINDDNFVIYNYCFHLQKYNTARYKPDIELKKLIVEKGITYSNLLVVYSLKDILSDEAKEWFKDRLLIRGYDKLENLFSLILDMYQNDKVVGKSIKNHLFENRENLLFFTGIHDDLNGRTGASPIDINGITSKMKFTKKEIVSIYDDLEKAMTKINAFNDKHKENLPDFYYENGQMYSIMIEFLLSNKKLLERLDNYENIKNKIYYGIERLGIKVDNFKLDARNVFTDEGNSVYYFLEINKKIIKYNQQIEPKILWPLLLTKILKTEEPKFHVAFEFLLGVLDDLNEKNKWIRKYHDFYDIILKHYFELKNNDLDFEDKQFVVMKNVELSTILKEKYRIETAIIQKWLDYKNESEYMTVRKMKKKV